MLCKLFGIWCAVAIQTGHDPQACLNGQWQRCDLSGYIQLTDDKDGRCVCIHGNKQWACRAPESRHTALCSMADEPR
jgi:hypothetical protein